MQMKEIKDTQFINSCQFVFHAKGRNVFMREFIIRAMEAQYIWMKTEEILLI